MTFDHWKTTEPVYEEPQEPEPPTVGEREEADLQRGVDLVADAAIEAYLTGEDKPYDKSEYKSTVRDR